MVITTYSDLPDTMMNKIDDALIHQIAERVLAQVLGQAPAAPSPAPAQAAAASPVSARRVVAIGSDHGGFELKETLKAYLTELGYDPRDVGTKDKVAVDYPDFAHAVARLVASGDAWRGIMIDGAGIGSCIVANKVPGVRAGLAYDYSSAVNGREHNDTNLLTLGAGLIGASLARQIVRVWLETDFGGGRHAGRVAKISSVEKQYLK